MNSDIIKVALGEYGNREVTGSKHNPEIVKYFKEIGFNINDDETAWCSALMNWVCMKAGYIGSKKLNARSWLNVGIEIEIPEIGDVVVFYRGDPKGWQGHVAIFIRFDGVNVWVLGGNQKNQVSIQAYPVNQVLGYRRLEKKAA